MVFSVTMAAVFATVGLYMTIAQKGVKSKRMAWIPSVVAVVEIVMCGMYSMADYPIGTLILMACRVTVLTCCVIALKRDAAAERNRRRRREVWRRVSYAMTAELQDVVVCPRCA